jgi:cyanophycinase-like exopeptidase
MVLVVVDVDVVTVVDTGCVVVVGAGSVVVVGPQAAQQVLLPLTVPPLALQSSADRLMLHFMPITQSFDLSQERAGFLRQVPVLGSHPPLRFGRRQATAPSLPHVDRAAQRTTAPRHSSETSSCAAAATQLTYSP